MTRDDIIRMAEHAGFGMPIQVFQFRAEELERFAALVAAAEREACAKTAEVYGLPGVGAVVAAVIRARGEQEQPR